MNKLMQQILQRLDEMESRLEFFEAENVVERLENIDHVDIDSLVDRVASIERLIEDNAPPDEEEKEEDVKAVFSSLQLDESTFYDNEENEFTDNNGDHIDIEEITWRRY
jgi:hypothetical protein